MSTPRNKDLSWYLDCAIFLTLFSVIFFIFLGNRPLFIPDEGRYAEIAREMAASGNFITPYLNEIKYFEKPILFYWLTALAIKVAGLNLWSVRCVNALLAIFGCLLTYFTTRNCYGRLTGVLAALILATSSLYFVMAHMVSLDLMVSFFLLGCLYFFLLANISPAQTRYYYYLSAASAAFAVLTKGLIGIVFPIMIIGSWLTLLGKWRTIKPYWLGAVTIFLLIVIPWHLLMEWHNPGFAYFYFIEQHFLRYATMGVGHYQPVWYFFPVLILGFFPWVVFLPQALFTSCRAIWRNRHQHPYELFFILWAGLIFIFFSFSKSKLIPYILPIFPALSILIAQFLINTLAQTRMNISLLISYLVLAILSIVLSSVLFIFGTTSVLSQPVLGQGILLLCASILSMSGLMFLVLHQLRPLSTLFLIACSQAVLLLVFLYGAPALDTRSILPLAATLRTQSQPEDEVITYNQYFQDLPFYLQRKVSILNWRNELSHGATIQKNVNWLLNDEQFWQHWHSGKRVFVLISKEELSKLEQKYPEQKFYVLAMTVTNALISNQQGPGI